MLDSGVKGNVVSYNSVISACAKGSDAGGAEAWLQRRLDSGVKGNVVRCGELQHRNQCVCQRRRSWQGRGLAATHAG